MGIRWITRTMRSSRKARKTDNVLKKSGHGRASNRHCHLEEDGCYRRLKQAIGGVIGDLLT